MSGYGQQEYDHYIGITRTHYTPDQGYLGVHELALLISQALQPTSGHAEIELLGRLSAGSWAVVLPGQELIDGTYGLVRVGLQASGGGIESIETAISQYGQAVSEFGNSHTI